MQILPFDVSKVLTTTLDVLCADHIWEVCWEAKLPVELIEPSDLKCSSCGTEFTIAEARRIVDRTAVLGSSDGQEAIDKVRLLVTNPQVLGSLTDFKVTGLQVLAVAEM